MKYLLRGVFVMGAALGLRSVLTEPTVARPADTGRPAPDRERSPETKPDAPAPPDRPPEA